MLFRSKENNITNVYEIRQFGGGKKNLTTMSPGHWTNNYDRNLIVNLDYIPEKLVKESTYKKFNLAYFSRRTSTADDLDFPYMDNFNVVNAVSKQVSVLPIQGTFICPLSNQPINSNNYHSDDGIVYNADYVDFDSNGPYLINDEITLDEPTEELPPLARRVLDQVLSDTDSDIDTIIENVFFQEGEITEQEDTIDF